ERGLHRARPRLLRALAHARRGGGRTTARAVRGARFRRARCDASGRARPGDDPSRLAHEAVDAEEIRRRFPLLTPPDDVVGFYQADYAMLPADRCLELLAAGARAAGA